MEDAADLMDVLDATDPIESRFLLEGRRINPSSAYMSWTSRDDEAVEGMKRLKDGAAEAVVGKTEHDGEREEEE